MGKILSISNIFSAVGNYIIIALTIMSVFAAISGIINIISSKPVYLKYSYSSLKVINILMILGFILICWFHYMIYCNVAIELPSEPPAPPASPAGRSGHGNSAPRQPPSTDVAASGGPRAARSSRQAAGSGCSFA